MFIAIVGYHFGWVVYGWLGQYGGKLGQNPHWGTGCGLAYNGRWARGVPRGWAMISFRWLYGPGAGMWALSVWWGGQGALHIVRRSSIQEAGYKATRIYMFISNNRASFHLW